MAQECVADVLLPRLDHYRLNCLDEPWLQDPKMWWKHSSSRKADNLAL